MSGGGEVRVLCQEAGQESPRMPAWKREILERRKAKGGGSGGAGAADTSPGGAGPQRANGETTGNASGGSGRNYTITPASSYFTNKEPRPAAPGRTRSEEGSRQESLVLQDSLGPLEENPFIKLEKERRRRQEQENAARPVQHILELYGSAPGVRTIRAENIIIIESDPDYLPGAGGANRGSQWQHNGVSSSSSLDDLLERRGGAVTEIRAQEVVIYDTGLSRSEENLSTLGRPGHVSSQEAGAGLGRVSRMLRKFDSNYGKLQKKSRSTENLLDLDGGAGGRPRPRPKPQPDPVPTPVFQSPRSSRPKPQVSEEGGPRPPAPPALPPQPVSSFRHRLEENGGRGAPVIPRDEVDKGPSGPTREGSWEGEEVPPKPTVPCSPENLRARAESPPSHVASTVSRSSPDFEIRPSPKPDLAQIPDGDPQALALANLRLQSRNSFTVIPKRRLVPSSAAGSQTASAPNTSPPSHGTTEEPAAGGPTSHAPMLDAMTKRNEEEPQETEVKTPARPSGPGPSPPPVGAGPPSTSEPSSPPPASGSPPAAPSPPSSPAPSPALEQPPADHLPVTNIDEIDVEPPQRPPAPAPSPTAQRRKGTTFTVVPKRRVEPAAQPGSPEPQQELSGAAPGGSTPPPAPYAQLGSLLKKRYPAVEEIEVVGGYLALAKPCLCRAGCTGKKLKISFNETSLQSTYEYPSESSVWDSGEEEEDEEEKPDEQPSMVGRIHIPRPSFASSPTHAPSNDLSSYVPKHSVDFSAWQEHMHDDGAYQDAAAPQQTPRTEEVMLTPADSSSLSDYSSEPALYF
ncbi:taperin [Brachionichthys hirsutus]|uniref:taperin n=1 Tax=Brachionichthys hirsutus TaxID=412623 RepID=UPI00360476E2